MKYDKILYIVIKKIHHQLNVIVVMHFFLALQSIVFLANLRYVDISIFGCLSFGSWCKNPAKCTAIFLLPSYFIPPPISETFYDECPTFLLQFLLKFYSTRTFLLIDRIDLYVPLPVGQTVPLSLLQPLYLPVDVDG